MLSYPIQFCHSVVSDSLRSHGLQHARLLCPSPTPRVCSDPCRLSWWCCLNYVILCCPFSICLLSFPASGPFSMSRLIVWGGQSVGTSASAISLSSEYSGLIFFRIDWFDPFTAQGTFRVFSSTTIQKHQFFSNQPSLCVLFQFSSVLQSCPTLATPWAAACQASLSISNSWGLLRFVSIELVMPSNHLTLYSSLLLLSWMRIFSPPAFPSIRVFSKESVLHIGWLKYWSFSISISISNEYSGLIFFRIDWFDLAV